MERMKISPSTTLEQAKQWLRERLRGGAPCPCCGQMAKVYKRALNANMARILISAYRQKGLEWFHAPSLKLSHEGTGDIAKLRYWGLVEEDDGTRDDGGRTGWWRVTEAGAAFASNESRVAKYALLYNGKFLRHEDPMIDVIQALGVKFNYRELMDA